MALLGQCLCLLEKCQGTGLVSRTNPTEGRGGQHVQGPCKGTEEKVGAGGEGLGNRKRSLSPRTQGHLEAWERDNDRGSPCPSPGWEPE